MLLAVARPARAWVERAVKSDSATVDVDRDGSAVVTHEILLWVRGGPLPEITVAPIDADAEMMDGATAVRAESGRAAGFPVPLSPTRQDTQLELHVLGEKGLRSGTYLIRFSYRTHLSTGDHVHTTPSGTILEWRGPSFDDGIDSERVVFRVPPGNVPLRLPSTAGGDETLADDARGVFLSSYRRTSDKDELEVVRPHVAKGEIVSWRVAVDASALDIAAPPGAAEPAPVHPASVIQPAPRSRPSPVPYVVAGLLGILFGGAVLKKALSIASACRERRATPRSLVLLAPAFRAVLGATGILSATAMVLSSAPPILAAVSLFVAIAAAIELPPRAIAPLRGPGKWVRLSPESAFDDTGKAPMSGFLDAGTWLGFVLFLALLAGFVATAIVVMRHSDYYGLSVALASSLLFPIFCTGRVSDLPQDPARAPADLLEFLDETLARDARLTSHPLGRVPHGGDDHDELRLFVAPRRPLAGFVAIEVGLDAHQGALGLLPLPFILVRVSDGSPAADALPKGLLWTRGRNADERVAVLRPKLPTRRLTARLVSEIGSRLAIVKPVRVHSPSSAPRSSGKGSVTANPATASSPVHAT